MSTKQQAKATKEEPEAEEQVAERKSSVPRKEDYGTRLEFLDAMVEHWQAKRKHFLEHGDARKQKAAKKAGKLREQLLALKADPEFADLLKDVQVKQ